MVKKIAFGTNKLRDPLILSECIYEAQNVGYEFVDTSWFYGNESALGRAKVRLESKKQQLLIKIHSKVWFTQYKGGVGKAFQLALGKLHRRNFNSYGLHRPHHDLRLTLKAWEQLVKYKRMNAEQLENIGVSNFNKDIIELLYESSGVYPEYNQIELSVNNFRFDRVAYCKTKKITLEALVFS